jgi:hypothetical protein
MRANTRDAIRPTPIPRVRAHPPPIDVRILTSGLPLLSAATPARQAPARCADVLGCKARLQAQTDSVISEIYQAHAGGFHRRRFSENITYCFLPIGDRLSTRILAPNHMHVLQCARIHLRAGTCKSWSRSVHCMSERRCRDRTAFAVSGNANDMTMFALRAPTSFQWKNSHPPGKMLSSY